MKKWSLKVHFSPTHLKQWVFSSISFVVQRAQRYWIKKIVIVFFPLSLPFFAFACIVLNDWFLFGFFLHWKIHRNSHIACFEWKIVFTKYYFIYAYEFEYGNGQWSNVSFYGFSTSSSCSRSSSNNIFATNGFGEFHAWWIWSICINCTMYITSSFISKEKTYVFWLPHCLPQIADMWSLHFFFIFFLNT